MLCLTTVGRHTGRTRVAILGYLADGENILVPAMNGWMNPEPAWWLNLQAHPDATIRLPGGEVREVRARAAAPGERERLWRRFTALGTAAYSDANAAARSRQAAIVILSPQASQE
jgi:deazaflavin-dependent oxidoreductase (nitroreductase family)